MRIVQGLDQYPADARPSVVAQGTFDGIHLGHQAVIRTAVGRAGDLGVLPVVVTFDPMPIAVLRPADAPPEILPLEERLEHIAALGPAVCLVIPFTAEFSRVGAEAYVRDVLLGLLRAREIVVGFNHTFGRAARGTPELLEQVAGPAGVKVHVVPPLRVEGIAVSSTSVREALRAGDVRRAQSLLGRPYTLRGVVARGAARGRALGFPTANLAPPPRLLLADGVYAARAAWDGESAPAVVNVGVRPTFDGGQRLVEAHLLDVAPELYGRRLTLAFRDRLRPERRFGSVEALRAQIAEDVASARRVLGAPR
jgi:riboflavin kinase/FMN adenylyltransferase